MDITVNKNIRKIIKIFKIQILIFLRVLTSFLRKYPDFIIIGVQKGGTTSLYKYLELHSLICPSLTKEVHFFNDRYNKKPLIWYKAFMPISLSKKQKVYEATPSYIFHPEVADRIYKRFPKIKILIILRNPIERAYSHYQMNIRGGRTSVI